MKKLIRNAHEALQRYWRHMLNNSSHTKMSCGSQYITRALAFRGDQCMARRERKK